MHAHQLGELGLKAQRSRHRVPLVTTAWCESEGLPCTATSADAAAAEDVTNADEEATPFELPRADEIGLYDFYCGAQPPGLEGTAALQAAGESLRKALPVAAEAGAEPPAWLAEGGSRCPGRS